MLVAGPEVLNRCLSSISGFRTKIIRRLGKTLLSLSISNNRNLRRLEGKKKSFLSVFLL